MASTATFSCVRGRRTPRSSRRRWGPRSTCSGGQRGRRMRQSDRHPLCTNPPQICSPRSALDPSTHRSSTAPTALGSARGRGARRSAYGATSSAPGRLCQVRHHGVNPELNPLEGQTLPGYALLLRRPSGAALARTGTPQDCVLTAKARPSAGRLRGAVPADSPGSSPEGGFSCSLFKTPPAQTAPAPSAPCLHQTQNYLPRQKGLSPLLVRRGTLSLPCSKGHLQIPHAGRAGIASVAEELGVN